MDLKKLMPFLTNPIFWFTFLGIIFLILGYFVPFNNDVFKFNEIFKVLGSAALSGGVFAFLAKSKRFSDVIYENLRQIIYTREHLANRTDLEEIWERVTEELCNQKFNSISKKFQKDIKQFYLPIERDYYYKDIDVDIDFDPDDDNPGYVKVQRRTKFTVVQERIEEFKYVSSKEVIIPEGDNNRTYYKINEFVVDGVNRMQDLKVTEVKKKGVYDAAHQLDINIKKKEYEIVRKDETYLSLKANPVSSYVAIWVYHNYKVNISYPTEMKITWMDLGVVRKWTNDTIESRKLVRLTATYKGLLFKNQGFLLLYDDI